MTGGSPQRAAQVELAGAEKGRVGPDGRLDRPAWSGQPGLDHDPALPSADQPRRLGQQGQGLLGGSEAGRQQLLVEVHEGHRAETVGSAHPVQHRLGPHQHVGASGSSAGRRP